MKKTILLASMMLAAVCAQAQLKVNEDGRVNVGNAAVPGYLFSSLSANNVLGFIRSGAPTTSDTWVKGADIWNMPSGSHFYIGLKAYARRSAVQNAGRAFGIWGEAGNTTSGYNYGVYGYLYGEQNGAAIYGTLNNDNGMNVGGRYAGYFAGDVKVTGSIYGTVLSASASPNAVSAQAALATNAATAASSVTSKLTQLSPIQYNLNQPVMAASVEGDTATTVHTMSAMEIQHFQKPHYGLVATELREVMPELVYEGQDGELCINYIEMIPLLVESIKELKAEIAALQGGNNGGAIVMSRAISGATDIEESAALTIPMLKQNNPNPFTENTVVEYYLPETVEKANLYIYDMNGKQIEQIPLTERGDASFTVNGGQLAAGMYLYSLIADGKVIDTKRMILTK